MPMRGDNSQESQIPLKFLEQRVNSGFATAQPSTQMSDLCCGISVMDWDYSASCWQNAEAEVSGRVL